MVTRRVVLAATGAAAGAAVGGGVQTLQIDGVTV
jgi:hypothetical protein